MSEKTEMPGGNPTSGRPARSEKVNYKKLAGGKVTDQEEDRRSVKSTKAIKSMKSVRSGKQCQEKGRKGTGKDEGDSSSVSGGEEERLQDLEQQISELQPTFIECYNNYKVQEGHQERLEDSELPDELEKDEVFDETKKIHLQQKKVTIERSKRASRRLELIQMREEILAERELAEQKEWEADMIVKERQLEMNRRALDWKRREKELEKEERWQMKQLDELEDDMDEGMRTQAVNKVGKVGHTSDDYVTNIMSERPVAVGTREGKTITRQQVMRALFKENKQSVDIPIQHTSSRVEDWIASHPQAQHDNVVAADLQKSAKMIIDEKLRTRPIRKPNKVLQVQEEDSELEDEVELVTTGVRHLKRLQLVPGGFGPRTQDQEDRNMSMQTRSKTGRRNPNCSEVRLGYNVGLEGEDQKVGQECGCGSKANVKSGKFAKTNINIVKQELWPHVAVLKKYLKRTSFDLLDYEGFVAGESRIIHTLLTQGNSDAVGRTKVLTLIAHWYGKTRNWALVRSLYEVIIEEVEMGESDWMSDFSGYETMLPSAANSATEVTGNKVGRRAEVYWCKAYQNLGCELTSPHMAQIKVDEPPVPVMHVCAYCWSNYRKRKEHAEVECMAKK